MIKNVYFRLLRCKEWIKNLIVFAPLIYSGNFFNEDSFCKTLYVIFCFCIASSIIYIINDYLDQDSDSCHKSKKLRPIVSGEISLAKVLSIFIFLNIILIFFLLFEKSIILIIFTYISLNILYSFYLKSFI